MTVSVCIIGSGFGMYGLLPAFSEISNCKVLSICGKNSERMSNFCKKFNVKQYNDWKEMLYKERPDAIAVAVIPKHQFEIIKFALENNIAVFAEKPLTTSYKTSLELCKIAVEKKLPNMINFMFPEIPEWKTLKKLIENKKIGKISNIDVTWTFLSYDLKNHIKTWKTDVTEGGGALSLFFSHGFHYLEYFLGSIINLQCTLNSSKLSLNKGETGIEMSVTFENGCKGNIHVNISNSENPTHILEFHGTDGKLILKNITSKIVDDFELYLHNSNKQEKIDSSHFSVSFPSGDFDPRVKYVSALAWRFIQWCDTKSFSPTITVKPDFQDGLRVQELIETARTSVGNVLILPIDLDTKT